MVDMRVCWKWIAHWRWRCRTGGIPETGTQHRQQKSEVLLLLTISSTPPVPTKRRRGQQAEVCVVPGIAISDDDDWRNWTPILPYHRSLISRPNTQCMVCIRWPNRKTMFKIPNGQRHIPVKLVKIGDFTNHVGTEGYHSEVSMISKNVNVLWLCVHHGSELHWREHEVLSTSRVQKITMIKLFLYEFVIVGEYLLRFMAASFRWQEFRISVNREGLGCVYAAVNCGGQKNAS